tara:strand:- start:52 stop:903 length:852 start_codon:yes stop_codon:yes gene_type:complete
MALQLMGNWGQTATIDDIRQLDDPEPMGSRHVPVRHDYSWEIIQDLFNYRGFELTNPVPRLSENTKRMLLSFDIKAKGSTTLAFDANGIKMNGFIINYQDQTGRFTFCWGEETAACTNQQIVGEHKVQHKNTANLVNNLRLMLWDQVTEDAMAESFDKLTYRNDDMRGIMIDPQQASHYIIEAGKRGIITWRDVPKVVEYWEKPDHKEFEPRNLYSLSNSFTGFFQEMNPFNVSSRSLKLVDMMDEIRTDIRRENEYHDSNMSQQELEDSYDVNREIRGYEDN